MGNNQSSIGEYYYFVVKYLYVQIVLLQLARFESKSPMHSLHECLGELTTVSVILSRLICISKAIKFIYIENVQCFIFIYFLKVGMGDRR